jgi:hypothetical protein
MNLACTMTPGRGDTDLILARLATDLATRGLRLCGTVQINTKRPGANPCDMDVRVLPDGPVPSARGCRLDPEALEAAVGLVAARLATGADLLIVNKFGKHEAEGHGFRHVIAEALAMEVPVLVGLNGLNRAAFEDFAGGLATPLPPERDALARWAEGAIRPATETA